MFIFLTGLDGAVAKSAVTFGTHSNWFVIIGEVCAQDSVLEYNDNSNIFLSYLSQFYERDRFAVVV